MSDERPTYGDAVEAVEAALDQAVNERDTARADLEKAVGLLERMMVWASGVAFKSAEGEALVRDTDVFLARDYDTRSGT